MTRETSRHQCSLALKRNDRDRDIEDRLRCEAWDRRRSNTLTRDSPVAQRGADPMALVLEDAGQRQS
jgi:hypothetical protein